MRLLVLSDIHDHIQRLRRALREAPEADLLLCLGDLCSPFMVGELARGFDGPVHVVFGNNDGDAYRITRSAREHEAVHLHGEFADLSPSKTGGARVALHHFPGVAEGLAAGDRYDVVCFGHSHESRRERVGETLLLNPGEIMGRFGTVEWAVYDTESRSAEGGGFPVSGGSA